MISAPLQSEFVSFLSWWRDELKALVPGNFGLAASRGSNQPVLMSMEATGLCVIDLKSAVPGDPEARRATAKSQNDAIVDLTGLARERSSSAVRIRLPYSACFARRLELPAGASSNFARMLALDLERATPFKVRDVYFAHYVEKEPAEPGKVWVRQLVIKRAVVDRLKEAIKANGLEVVAIDCWSKDGSASLPVNFLETEAATRPAGRLGWSMSWLLAGLAAALSVAGAFLIISRLEAALADLQRQSAILKTRSQAARENLAHAQVIYSEIASLQKLQTETVSKLAVIEEITRLLPDTASVSDLRIEGATVDITGVANSAAALLPLLERSTLFYDANPTAPIMFDQREEKDRFSIRVRIRNRFATTPDKNVEPRE